MPFEMCPVPGKAVMMLSEDETVDTLLRTRKSLARYGDAEIVMMQGRGSKYQNFDARAQAELKTIAKGFFEPELLVALPHNDPRTPRHEWWSQKFLPLVPEYFNMRSLYGSSFITRPDHATWIDNLTFWNKLRQLWAGEKIILVGSGKSLTAANFDNAEFQGMYTLPLRHAFELIDDVEKFIKRGKPTTVILCAGIMATCLAARLAHDGIRALDLGAVGQMKHWHL